MEASSMAKKKPIVPKAASTEALDLAFELLEVAETDLAAALTLHRAAHYPQAVFYLQQSVEKVGKAFGLGMGIAEPNQLHTEWSHNTLKHTELLADYRAQEGRTSNGMAPDELKEFMNELKDPAKMNGPAMEFFVEWVLSLIKQHNEYKGDPGCR
jgi:HEPN domain-containing protein